jgi:hypothetical protein
MGAGEDGTVEFEGAGLARLDRFQGNGCRWDAWRKIAKRDGVAIEPAIEPERFARAAAPKPAIDAGLRIGAGGPRPPQRRRRAVRASEQDMVVACGRSYDDLGVGEAAAGPAKLDDARFAGKRRVDRKFVARGVDRKDDLLGREAPGEIGKGG